MRLTPLFAAAVFAALHTAAPVRAGFEVQDGDIIFHRSLSSQSDAIAAATKSRFTHVGIIFVENGREMVYEACGSVKATPLQKWIQSGKDGHYVIKRLREADQLDARRLKNEVRKMRGRCYDPYFDWSDSRIYCSELVWKAYSRGCGIELGQPQQMRDFDLSSPLVRAKLKERYGSKVPLDMKVIAPSDIYSSDHLKTVDSGGGTLDRVTGFLGQLLSRGGS